VVKGLIVSVFEGNDGTGIANAMRGPEAAYGAIGTADETSTPLAQSVVTGRVVAQIATEALTIPKADFSEILVKSNDLLRVILSHAAEVVRSHELTLNCSRHHRIDRRLAHFLRMLEFYNRSSDLPVTHAGLGEILGVRRESVSTALAEYERKGTVQVNRGQIFILDSRSLEYSSCECQSELAVLKIKQTTGLSNLKNISAGDF
jgi:CRP-like cAMP-binding protein